MQYPWVIYLLVMNSDNQDMSREEHWRLRLVELLDHLKVTQVAFAHATNIDATYVSRLLYPLGKKGRKNLGLDTMRAICSTYQLRGDWFDMDLGSELPARDKQAVPASTAASSGVAPTPLLLPGVEEQPPEYPLASRPWPFSGSSYQKLTGLKKLLGRDYQVALRDIEENIETAILKWEVRATAKKGRRQSA